MKFQVQIHIHQDHFIKSLKINELRNYCKNKKEYLIDEMKVKYKLTTADKINDLLNKLDLIKAFMNVFKQVNYERRSKKHNRKIR